MWHSTLRPGSQKQDLVPDGKICGTDVIHTYESKCSPRMQLSGKVFPVEGRKY